MHNSQYGKELQLRPLECFHMLRFVAKIAASFFVSIDLSVNSLLAYRILKKLMINKPSAKDFATKQCIFLGS